MKHILLAGMISLGLASSAHAGPITFEFVYPNWDSNLSPALFGTNPILTITLDNGSNNINQIYDLANDVVEFTVVADGGTFSNTWLGSEIYSTNGSSPYSYISTNSSGIATMDFVTDYGNRIVFSNSGGTWQFGGGEFTSGGGSGHTRSWLTTGPAFGGSVAFHNTSSSFSVTGSTVSAAVPEPSTFALLGIGGLALVGYGWRRKRQQAA